ncbi:SnoaL-like domain-containing protein [Thermaurantiacus tibetensis]|uniref:SnoaL-like domain-containing protein n=1 Tax=Thermaurantiacus tibetensis TaxID=2759035 RepID=UPI00188FA505|nr:SnoaL-like domain-containing protein [Thermaurantiacus tibetensis]
MLEIAEHFTDLCAEGRLEDAAETDWAGDIATDEAAPGDDAETHGKGGRRETARWWAENHEVHDSGIDGPFVNGNQFILSREIEVTPRGGARIGMEETILQTVRDGKTVEQRDFC